MIEFLVAELQTSVGKSGGTSSVAHIDPGMAAAAVSGISS
jgi:hypothetical protein